MQGNFVPLERALEGGAVQASTFTSVSGREQQARI